jgi:hypothetical protein
MIGGRMRRGMMGERGMMTESWGQDMGTRMAGTGMKRMGLMIMIALMVR